MNSRIEAPLSEAVEREYPAELLERYELLECFCDKGDSRTLLARERSGDELAVVKCFMRDGPLYDRVEPRPLRSLDAPPMPRFIGEYRGEAMRCVVREYVPGQTLSELAGDPGFTRDGIIDIGMQLCDQLAALHGTDPPVIHRDIKPQNVVIRPDGRAVLIDFGISRVADGDGNGQGADAGSDTVVFGTQGYAPPEQYGFARTDARSDIFALGVLLNWLLRGNTELPKHPATPLERVVARCTAFDPRRRYATAGQVKQALKGCKSGVRRLRRAAIAACAACAVAVAALLGVRMARRAAEAASFACPLIEQAARLNLGLSDGERLTRDRLGEVEGIYIVADKAYPDADSFYPAINQWYADEQPTRGDIENLDDLALLPNLRQVCVVAQNLRDISALAGLEFVDKVEFKHNNIEDITPLAGNDRLTSVGLNDNPLRDLSPLEKCPSLAFLDLCGVRAYDPTVMERLGNFDYLDISNPTGSYKYLGGKNIHALSVSWTGLTDLNDLSGVIGLENLSINHTAVSDLSPIAVHAGLTTLNIAATPAKDLSPLLELPMLREVVVSEDMLPLVEDLGKVSFDVRRE